MQQPKVYTVSDHEIGQNLIDEDALYVLKKLREAGFLAYLVGGSVRDLLLKRTPKDFDISTDAKPEEIKQIFQRRCLLIGRRFRLAHIRFGHKVIEVSTFRSGEADSDLIEQDNIWGTAEQDVTRRDFTINGLFYDPATHTIIDYVGGWEDIHQNILRTIGQPEKRFKQDPVRMIRLLKFRARFGFQILPEARRALIQCKETILKSSQARILEEILRMLESGAASPFFNLMMESGLLELLFPLLNSFLKTEEGKEVFLFLSCADKFNKNLGKQKLDRSILLSCLLYPMMKHTIKTQFLDQQQIPHFGEILMAGTATIKRFVADSFAIFPRRLTALSHEIITTQYRLTPIVPKKHPSMKIFRYKEFPKALTFLQLRAVLDKSLLETYDHWKKTYRSHNQHPQRKVHHPRNVNPSD